MRCGHGFVQTESLHREGPPYLSKKTIKVSHPETNFGVPLWRGVEQDLRVPKMLCPLARFLSHSLPTG